MEAGGAEADDDDQREADDSRTVQSYQRLQRRKGDGPQQRGTGIHVLDEDIERKGRKVLVSDVER